TPDRSDAGQLRHAGERRSEGWELCAGVREGRFAQQRKRLESNRARERVRGVRVAVKELLELVLLAEKGRVDLLGREGGGEREVAARDPLGEAEEVGGDGFLLAGEQGAGAAEASGDLIHDDVHAVASAELGRLREEAAR